MHELPKAENPRTDRCANPMSRADSRAARAEAQRRFRRMAERAAAFREEDRRAAYEEEEEEDEEVEEED